MELIKTSLPLLPRGWDSGCVPPYLADPGLFSRNGPPLHSAFWVGSWPRSMPVRLHPGLYIPRICTWGRFVYLKLRWDPGLQMCWASAPSLSDALSLCTVLTSLPHLTGTPCASKGQVWAAHRLGFDSSTGQLGTPALHNVNRLLRLFRVLWGADFGEVALLGECLCSVKPALTLWDSFL